MSKPGAADSDEGSVWDIGTCIFAGGLNKAVIGLRREDDVVVFVSCRVRFQILPLLLLVCGVGLSLELIIVFWSLTFPLG